MVTILSLDDLSARAEKPAANLVPRKNKSLGFIRIKKQHGRIYYLWVRTVYRGQGLSPKQELILHIGQQLPHGVKLGQVDQATADKLQKYVAGKAEPAKGAK